MVTLKLEESFLVSLALHVLLLLFMTFGLPQMLPPLPKPYQPIPIDIVDIGEITNTRTKDLPPAPPKPPTPKPAEVAKKAPPPEATPEEEKTEAPQEEAQAEPVPEEAEKPKPKEKPKKPEKKPEPEKKKANPFDAMLKNLAQNPAPPSAEDAPRAKEAAAPAASDAPSLSDRLTISEEDALRRQIQGCWNIPIGSPNPESLIVEVVITVNEDRTVRSAQIVDQARMGADRYFRSAAESALRALKNPRCSPLALPPDKYNNWNTIRFTFDPRDII